MMYIVICVDVQRLYKKYRHRAIYSWTSGKLQYLKINLNNENDTHDEVRLILNTANCGYYAIKKMFISKLMSKQKKHF